MSQHSQMHCRTSKPNSSYALMSTFSPKILLCYCVLCFGLRVMSRTFSLQKLDFESPLLTSVPSKTSLILFIRLILVLESWQGIGKSSQLLRFHERRQMFAKALGTSSSRIQLRWCGVEGAARRQTFRACVDRFLETGRLVLQ